MTSENRAVVQPRRALIEHPTEAPALLRAAQGAVEPDIERERSWSAGFSRRRLLQGGLGLGVAGIAEQLVTTRVAFAAPTPDPAATGTLVVVFLRGGMDGLSMLVPAEDARYLAARPDIAVRGRQLIQLDRGFGLHQAMEPLRAHIVGGRLAAVPGVSTPSITRSHFQAQACLESGGSAANDGWLDRLLRELGPGTTFRGLSAGHEVPFSLRGSLPVAMSNLSGFQLQGYDGLMDATRTAIERLYTGVDSALGRSAIEALTVEARVAQLAGVEQSVTARGYSETDWGRALAAVGSMIRAGLGVRVATVDLGGWDMHTLQGTADSGDFRSMTAALASGLATFMTDLGERADSTTVVVISEFGRRVGQNANAGTDHGHGGVAMVLGGGVSGGVKGTWNGLAGATGSDGDVLGLNDYRDLLAEVVMKRFGLSQGQASTIFPGWTPQPLGVMA